MQEAMEAHLSYLKLINVPTMFDVGCTQANPQTDSLTLSMMDSITNKIVKAEFLKKSSGRKASDIEKLRTQLQAIHTNMQVSSVDIQFDKKDPLTIGGDSPYMFTIDGNHLHKRKEKVNIARITVSRLLKCDDKQATVPIMTFLPLKEGDLKNQHIKQIQAQSK